MHLDVLYNGLDSHIMAIVCLLSFIRPLAFLSWSPPTSRLSSDTRGFFDTFVVGQVRDMLRASVGSAARAAGRLPSGALPQGSSLLWSVLEQCLRQQAEALFEQHSCKAAASDAMAQVGDLLDPPSILPCDAKCPGISFGRHDFRGSHAKGIVGWMSRPIVKL